MATIRAFTTIEQSRKLAEILPLESADAFYPWRELMKDYDSIYVPEKMLMSDIEEDDILAWSLAALLGVLPNGIVMNKDSQNGKYHFSSTHAGTYVTTDNPVDACVAMIEKLNELNLL